MKPNLRDSLHRRHRAAEPQLDAIRESVVQSLEAGRSSHAAETSTILQTLWRQVFQPLRYGWGALAGIWLVIAVLNVATTDVQEGASPASTGLRLAEQVAEREERLAQLLDLPDTADVDDAVLRPRGCARREDVYV